MSERETPSGPVAETVEAKTAGATVEATATSARPERPAPAPLLPPSIGGESVTVEPSEQKLPTSDALAHDPAVAHPEADTNTAFAAVITPGLSDVGAISDTASFSAGKGKVRIGDRIFAALTTSAGIFVVALIALVAIFLIAKAAPAIADDKANFLTSDEFNLDTVGNFRFGIAALLWVTVIASVIAMIIAVPVAVGIALFITLYAPKRLASSVAFLVNLLAAVPSIIYGLWGFTVFGPALYHVQKLFYKLHFIPLFKEQSGDYFTIFTGGVVLAIMILPIVTAVSRDVFDRTPRANIEAALALGATRWEMIRMAVLPYGRPGIISGAMLGLGRALGETIAVLLILHVPSHFNFSIMQGGQTFASLIALNAGEMSAQQAPAYIAAGLVLFVLTFLVNAAARTIVNRRKDFA